MRSRDDIAIDRGPEVRGMTEAECRRRLEGSAVGRIAMQGDDAPEIRPVNFLIRADDLVIRTGDGQLMAAAQRGESAGFEIDEIDRLEHTGWSVVVTGKLFELPSDDEHRALPLRAWASGLKDSFIGLAITRVSGLIIPAGRGNR